MSEACQQTFAIEETLSIVGIPLARLFGCFFSIVSFVSPYMRHLFVFPPPGFSCGLLYIPLYIYVFPGLGGFLSLISFMSFSS